MAGALTKVDMRRSKILERLKHDEAVSVLPLAAELGVSAVTIRSDLSVLENEGYLIRVQGGAVRRSPVKQESADINEDIAMAEEKLAIARQVSEQIRDGDTVFINSGTTMECVAAALKEHKNLNVVTNALAVALFLGKIHTLRVILLGGEINTLHGFTYGSDAQEQLAHYQADWAILSLDGISDRSGMTTHHAEEANINRMMIAQAKRTLIAADHTKIGRTGFFRFGDVLPGMQLITDHKAEPQAIAELEHRDVAVTCADI